MALREIDTSERNCMEHALLERSRTVRLRAVAACTEAKATRAAVADLITEARALQATLRITRRVAARSPSNTTFAPVSTELAGGVSAFNPGQEAVPQALALLGLSEDDLGDLVDDLIAAHTAARAWGDDEARASTGHALTLIGRYLARQIGPRAAGVALN